MCFAPRQFPLPLLAALAAALAGLPGVPAVMPAATARAAEPEPPAPGKLELADGDRVVLLGGTFIEREQAYGYLEAGLVGRFPGKKILVRNLGWSGDTVWGEARAGFGPASDGFNHLLEQVKAVGPTVILVAYGNNEAFAGPAGLEHFSQGLERLVSALTASGARIVLVTPLLAENLGPPLPDPSAYNANVRIYRDAIVQFASAHGLLLADILSAVSRPDNPPPLRVTDNGLHLTAFGYWRATPKILAALGLAEVPWLVELDGAKLTASSRVKITALERTPNGLKFRARDEFLPEAKAPPGTSELALVNRAPQRTLRVRGLQGRHALWIDGREIDSFSADEWAQGIVGMDSPDSDGAERLRRQIIAKNELYFHRWRPQNETYLFGFRKHEQGNNAAEIPKFDPMVTSKDERIRALTLPAEHVYELVQP